MRLESAELAKIAINFFLVSSVTTTNTLAEVCEQQSAAFLRVASLVPRVAVEVVKQEKLGEAMTRLNEREREILIERRLRDEPLTLEDLSRRFHVSRERIRQLEVRAVDKLRKAMLGTAKTLGLPANLVQLRPREEPVSNGACVRMSRA